MKKNSKTFCVYFHRNNINKKVYIGITSLKLKDRFGTNGGNYKRNKHFYSAIQKYGWNNFEHIIFMENLTKEEACRLEKILIALWETTNPKIGYNKSIGGEMSSLGVRHSEESKKNFSESKKGKKNPMFGKKLSEEHKQKISKSLTGKSYFFGKHLPEEMKQKISEANKGKIAWNKGMKMNDDFLLKLGKPVYCFELEMYFRTITEAGEFVGIGSNHITSCCKGNLKHTGRHPKTNERLSWRYATKEEYENWKKERNDDLSA